MAKRYIRIIDVVCTSVAGQEWTKKTWRSRSRHFFYAYFFICILLLLAGILTKCLQHMVIRLLGPEHLINASHAWHCHECLTPLQPMRLASMRCQHQINSELGILAQYHYWVTLTERPSRSPPWCMQQNDFAHSNHSTVVLNACWKRCITRLKLATFGGESARVV